VPRIWRCVSQIFAIAGQRYFDTDSGIRLSRPETRRPLVLMCTSLAGSIRGRPSAHVVLRASHEGGRFPGCGSPAHAFSRVTRHCVPAVAVARSACWPSGADSTVAVELFVWRRRVAHCHQHCRKLPESLRRRANRCAVVMRCHTRSINVPHVVGPRFAPDCLPGEQHGGFAK
jgi:hypothetical protein